MTGKPLQWPLAAVLVTAAFFLLQSLWIPAKAQLAQWLLAAAWQRTLEGAPDARPWPWADTAPAGVLEVPGHGIRQIVLDGASGRNLAFGPAALNAIDAGDVLISAHRDTHFHFLGAMEHGELIRLRTPGQTREFRVSHIEVIDTRVSELVLDLYSNRLTLLTCYPLDAPDAGGPLRLVVTALAARRAG
jgi:sortase A